MDIVYQHHIDREIESLIERIHPPRVCIDNDSCSDCTLIKELKVDIRAENRRGLLSNVTRVIRENGLSITKVHIQEEGDGKVAVGSFYVTEYSGQDVNANNIAELVRREIGGSIVAAHTSPYSSLTIPIKQQGE